MSPEVEHTAPFDELNGLERSVATTMYPVIGEPLSSGGLQTTEALSIPGRPVTLDGAPGGPPGVAISESGEVIPVPSPLLGVTLKV